MGYLSLNGSVPMTSANWALIKNMIIEDDVTLEYFLKGDGDSPEYDRDEGELDIDFTGECDIDSFDLVVDILCKVIPENENTRLTYTIHEEVDILVLFLGRNWRIYQEWVDPPFPSLAEIDSTKERIARTLNGIVLGSDDRKKIVAIPIENGMIRQA